MFHTKFLLGLLSAIIGIDQHQIIAKTLTPNELVFVTPLWGREVSFTPFHGWGT